MLNINPLKYRVVVTGIGVISPNGIGKEAFWRNSLNGKSGIGHVDFAAKHLLNSTVGGIVRNFDPLASGLSLTQVVNFDRYVQFALIAAQMAIKEAQLSTQDIQATSIGVSVANAIAGTRGMEKEFLKLTKNGSESINSYTANHSLFNAATFNIASTAIANSYGFCGPNITIPTGCTAGIDAIGFGFDLIRTGSAKIILAGAAEAPLTPIVMAAFDAIGALSTKFNHSPSQSSRPYDAKRNGFVLGEGCGILVLEEREHAIKRGVPILAEIKGYGSTCNAYHMTALPANGEDLARSITIALEDSNITAEDIDYISAHGSSTYQNDINETTAYKKIFGKRAYKIPINSLKSMCGHALGAANAIEIIAMIGCILKQQVHPTINYNYPDPECDLYYVPNKAIDKKITYGLKTSSGFSGIHSALVLSHPNL